MATIALGELCDDAVKLAQRHAVLPERQADFTIEPVTRCQIVVAAGEGHTQFKRRRQGFRAIEIDHRQIGRFVAGESQSEL